MMQTLRAAGCALVLTIAAAVPAMAADELPRLEPDPDIAALASKDTMTIPEYITAALIASGTPEEERDDYLRRLTELISRLPATTGNVAADGEAILQWMHEEILKHYVESQTRLDVLLDEGTYNCVSSAVLYLIFARSSGIPVHGVETTDHAFCRVPFEDDPEGGFDVETTIPFGFDPGRRHDAADSFTGRTGFVYVPPSNYRKRTDLDDRRLAALIYQNRLAALQRRGGWIEAVGLARDRWELSGSSAGRRDFITSLDNYAAEMNRQGRREEALALLAGAAAVLGDREPLYDSARVLLHNAVTVRLQAGDTDEALGILENQANTELVTSGDVEKLRSDIGTAVLERTVKEGGFREAYAAVDTAFSEGLINRARWEKFVLYLWSNEARRLSRGGQWLAGWEFVDGTSGEIREVLEKNGVLNTYSHNAVVTLHNEIVSSLRAGRLDEAETILEKAETMFPGDKTLERDRRSLGNMRSGE